MEWIDVLVVVDFQNDFLHPDGSLCCPVMVDGKAAITSEEKSKRCANVVQLINLFASKNYPIVFTRDWHPENSLIFTEPDPVTGQPWPKHCIQGTWGAEFYMFEDYKHVMLNQNVYVINKGDNEFREEYGAGPKWNPIVEYLHEKHRIVNFYVTGVATDFCVKANYEDLRFYYGQIERGPWLVVDAIIPAFDDSTDYALYEITTQDLIEKLANGSN